MDPDLYREFNALKKRKPSLKTFIAIGGWDAGSKGFSEMARRKPEAFIKSCTEFMEKYGFDGVDLDWEYPTAKERGKGSLRSTTRNCSDRV